MAKTKVRIKRNDVVVVIAGDDKGRRGKVLEVRPGEGADGRVVVEGVGLVKRHVKASGDRPGSIVEKEAAIHISNVALVDASGARVKVALRTDADGTKNRVNRKTGATVQG
jgi:large subunit ribosomal protein L24